jgi:hypothetical protein
MGFGAAVLAAMVELVAGAGAEVVVPPEHADTATMVAAAKPAAVTALL